MHYISTAGDCPGRTWPKEEHHGDFEFFLKAELNTLYLFKFRAISFHSSWLLRISEIKSEASQALLGGPCLLRVLLELLLTSIFSRELFGIE